MGLIGENGAGKSTLINAILGISESDYEQADILGYDIASQGSFAREDVATIFCDSHLTRSLRRSFSERCSRKYTKTGIRRHI